MAQSILLKRSSVAGNVPSSSDLSLGEIAINTADGAVYIKKGNNDIVAVHDNDILHIDTSNGRVGIGTTSPSYNLDVNPGSASAFVRFKGTHSSLMLDRSSTSYDANIMFQTNGATKWRIWNDGSDDTLQIRDEANTANVMTWQTGGKVGIGTSTPAKTFEVSFNSSDTNAGGNALSGGGSGSGFLIRNTNTTANTYANLDFRANNADGRISYKYNSTNSGDFHFITDNNDSIETKMIIKNAGNVGIGTTSPTYNLHVTGTGDTIAAVTAGASSVAGLNLGNSTNLADGGIRYDNNTDKLIFRAGNATKAELSSAGALTLNSAYTFPTSDGSANQVLQTDGSGNLTFATVSGGSGTITGVSNMADNRVITAQGATTINAESNLTFDGSTLDVAGTFVIDTNPAGTYGVHEALRIDDTGGTADRALQIFELCNAGARSHRLAFNTNITTTGSAYTHTQGLYGGSSAIHFGNSGEVVFYVNGQVTSGSADSITPTERFRIHSDGDVKFDGGNVFYDTSQNALNFIDNVYAQFGYGNDLQIYHSGSHSYLKANGTGSLYIENLAQDTGDIVMRINDGGTNKTMILIDSDVGVTKFQQQTRHNDNTKANFGSSNDLQIFHDGTDNNIRGTGGDIYITQDVNDGDILIESDNGSGGKATYAMADGSEGSFKLYHYGSKKLETISAGVKVTGSGTIGGNTPANGYLQVTDGSDTLAFDANEIHTTNNLFLNAEDGTIYLRGNDSGAVNLRNGSIQFMDTTRNLSNIGTISSGAITSGAITSSGRIYTSNGLFQANEGNQKFRQYEIGSSQGTETFLLGKIEHNDNADGGVTGTVKAAYDYGETVINCNIHFAFAQRNGAARGHWWYEHTDDDASTDVVSVRLVDDGSGNMFVWLYVGDYVHCFVDAVWRQCVSVTDSGTLAAATITTGTTLFDTANDPTSEHHIGRLYAHDHMFLPDGKAFYFGDGLDLNIWHSGTNSLIDHIGTGNLYIRNTTDDSDIIFQNDDGSGGLTEYFRVDGSSVMTLVSKPIKLFDGVELYAGTDNDMRFTHDGTNGTIDNYTGDLLFRNNANDKDVIFQTDNGSGGLAEYIRLDGSINETTISKTTKVIDNVYLGAGSSTDMYMYHDGSNSFIKNNTGNLTIQNNTDDGDIIFRSDDGSGGTHTYFYVDGSATRTVFEKLTRHNDNVYAAFGTDSDLRIYHDGSASYIDDTGTGYLNIRGNGVSIDKYTGETMASFIADGAVTLYHNNSSRLLTTSEGVLLTMTDAGNTAGPVLDFNRDSSSPADADYLGQLKFRGENDADQDVVYAKITAKSADVSDGTEDGAIEFTVKKAGSNNINARLSSTNLDLINGTGLSVAGNATITGNLTVNGSTTTISTATLDVEDKNITLNKGSGDTSSTANGAGITIQDAVSSSTDATILWDSSSNEFDFSHGVNVTAGNITGAGNIDIADKVRHLGDSDTYLHFTGANDIKLIAGGATHFHAASDQTTVIYSGNAAAITLNNSQQATIAGNLVVNGADVTITANIKHAGDSDTYFGFHNNNHWRVVTGGTERIEIRDSEIVVNDGGASYDFRVESDNDGTNLFSDGSTDRVGIGTSTPSTKLDVRGPGATLAKFVANSSDDDALVRIIGGNYNTEKDARLFLGEGDTYGMTVEYDGLGNIGYIGMNDNVDPTGAYSKRIQMSRGGTEVAFMAGNVGIGTASPSFAAGSGLEIERNGTATIRLQNTSGKSVEIKQQSDFVIEAMNSNQDIILMPTANVGIGQASPTHKLDVNGIIKSSNTNPQVRIHTSSGTGSGYLVFGDSADDDVGQIEYNHGDNSMRFKTAAAEEMRITSAGYVGIGTTAPTEVLHVEGNIELQNNGYIGSLDGNYWQRIRFVDDTPSSTNAFNFETRNGSGSFINHMTITNNGDVGIGTTSPASKLHINTGTGTNNANTVIIDRAGSSDYSAVSFATAGTVDWSIGHNSAGNFEIFEDGLDSSTRLTVESGGNVGIGETNPSHKVEAKGTDAALVVHNDGNSRGGIAALASQLVAFTTTSTNDDLVFGAAANPIASAGFNEKMRIDNGTGHVSIGTSAAGARKLDILDNSEVNGEIIQIKGNNSRGAVITYHRGSSYSWEAGIGGGSSQDANIPSSYWGVGERSASGRPARLLIAHTSGNVGIGVTPQTSGNVKLRVAGAVRVEEYQIDTTETSTTATTQVPIHTFAAADFRSARFTVQVTNSTDSTYHTTELLLVHDGTTANITEFGEIHTGSAVEATFDADVNSGNVRLLATPASTDSMEFKVVAHSVTT